MICIGVPVVRPLYKGFINKLISRETRSTSGYKKQVAGPRYGLKTFGGSIMPGASRWQANTTDGEEAATERMKGPFTHTKAVGGRSMPDSDEEILGEEYRAEVEGDAEDGGGGNIQVMNTWTVDQSSPAGSRGRY